MNKLFNIDSPIMVCLSRFADLILLSLMWFLCSIPIITIGPSTAALYYVTMKMVRQEEIKLGAGFFHAFKANFKQGIILNLFFIVVGTVLALDYLIMAGVEGTYGAICSACFLVLGIWVLCIMFYTYPLQAQFVNPVLRTLKNAAILCVRRPLNTVVVFAVNMVPVFVAMLSLALFIRIMPVWALLMPGAAAYVCAKRFVRIFDPMITPPLSQSTEET